MRKFGCALVLTVVFASAWGSDGQKARQAFRQAVYAGTSAERSAALAAGLKDADPLIRRQALWELYQDDRTATSKAMLAMLSDPSATVGTMIATLAGSISNDVKRVAFLKRLMAESSDPAVRTAAVRAMGFPFSRRNVAPSQDPQDDHAYEPIWKSDLPTTGWLLRVDRVGDAHLRAKPCFADDYDWRADNGERDRWRFVQIGQYWETQGIGKHYDGIGWYRTTFELPAQPKGGDSVELCFDGVDDEAWVWLNGVYVGQHCEGVPGCGKPFRFDVGKELRWNGQNSLTVRINDIGSAGGLCRGVRLEVLKCK